MLPRVGLCSLESLSHAWALVLVASLLLMVWAFLPFEFHFFRDHFSRRLKRWMLS